mmetsp:Transcript_39738/g.62051  ORF Transcript_39738/g.62051 Transcript_39738/m.62051 type:complete len:383 (+) Transcript_39738:402-1550(+)
MTWWANSFKALHSDFERLDPSQVSDIYIGFNLCQSCLKECKEYHEMGCGFDVLKEECLPEALLESCEACDGKGCEKVVEFINENEALNATAGGDNATKVGIFNDLIWKAAQHHSVEDMDTLKDCIAGAATVGLAEKCLSSFLHPMPATLLDKALDIAKTVGPPACAKSYTGAECSPAPKPEEHGGSCPQGFMCMPDPSKCEQCACSCNSPGDKLTQLSTCMTKAVNPDSGIYCLAEMFAQLPPDFVDKAIEEANEPAGAEEHYSQIVTACGGDENGTETVSSCLQQVEFCVRPLQGHPGEFPSDFTKYQPICECFRKPEVLEACGEDEETQKECAGAVQKHYEMHVKHKYCVHNTEVACEFQCQWPLPGFFGDVAKAGAKEE